MGYMGYILIEPVHEIPNNVVCTRSLIRAYACRLSIL